MLDLIKIFMFFLLLIPYQSLKYHLEPSHIAKVHSYLGDVYLKFFDIPYWIYCQSFNKERF